MIKRLALYCIVFSLSFVSLYGQTPETTINPYEFKADFLFKLIKKKVNENRYAYKSDSLIYHAVFNNAATAQAEWMVANKKEDIEQLDDPKMQTTVLRVASFGGTNHKGCGKC